MIEINNVTVEFGDKTKTKAVNHVNLTINTGEIFGIVGSSGAGKSTLLRTINQLQKITDGEILIDGENISNYRGARLRHLRKNIGMIFQHFNLVASKTVYQNIEFVLQESKMTKEEIRQRIVELLQFVGLRDKMNSFPENLSGGQKQRVAIARALANHTKILLCDEPTSALDLETTASVLQLLHDINQKLGITIVIITHELEVVKTLCDRVAVMNQGELIETGNVYEVFTNPRQTFTKNLISHASSFEIPSQIIDQIEGPIVRLTYQDRNAESAVLSEAASRFSAQFNILHGKIEYISGKPLGILYVNIKGSDKIVEEAINYLNNHTEKLEVL